MKFRIVYDCGRKRPGCALLQAVMGGTVPNFSALFADRAWLTTPTKDMALYEVSEEQLALLVEISELR